MKYYPLRHIAIYIYVYIYIYITYTKLPPVRVSKADYSAFLFSLSTSTLTFQSLMVTPSTTRNIKANSVVCCIGK